jgi:hypothetical protein
MLSLAMKSYRGVNVRQRAVISELRNTITSLHSHLGLFTARKIALVFVQMAAELRTDKFVPLPGIEAQYLDCPTRKLVTAPTELTVQYRTALLSLSFLMLFVSCLIICLDGRIHTQQSNQLISNEFEINIYL